MDGTGITPVMDINHGYGDGLGFGGGSGIWLFAILALMWGGNGFFGNRNGYGASPATVEDLATQSNFTRLEAQGTAIAQEIGRGFTNLGNGICNSTYELKSAIDGVAKDMATCCCGIQKDILESRYLTAQEIAGVKEVIAQNKIESLQARVNELQLNQALCGVVRYPTQTTYAAANPFCGCGNNFANI